MARMVDGKVVVVTGSGGGIGKGIALLMAAHGAKVVVNDIGAALDGSGHDDGPAAATVREIACMPNDVNVLSVTILPTTMPFFGRG